MSDISEEEIENMLKDEKFEGLYVADDIEETKQNIISKLKDEMDQKLLMIYATIWHDDDTLAAEVEIEELISATWFLEIPMDGDKEQSEHSKSILTDTANATIPVRDAFAEILDNIIQNYNDRKRNGEGVADKLEINITINLDGTNQSIFIQENSGGISESGRKSLARYGISEASSSSASIGVWGWGTKLAFAALSRDIRVFTREFDEDGGHCMHWNLEWWTNDSDWDLPKGPIPKDVVEKIPLGEGTTRIELRELEPKSKAIGARDGLQELKDYLGKIYSEFLGDGDVIIRFNGHLCTDPKGDLVELNYHFDKDDLTKSFTFMPGNYPQIFKLNFEGTDSKGEERKLSATVYVGLWEENLTHRRGVMMWGNGRLFTDFPVTAKFGSGKADTTWRKGWNMKGNTNMYIFFEAENPRDIPWMAPVKKGFSTDHFFSGAIIQQVREIAQPWFALSTIINTGLGSFNKAFLIEELPEEKDRTRIEGS